MPLLLLPRLLPIPLLILLLLPSTASNKGPTTHLLQSKSLTVSRCILTISLLWGRSYYYPHSANLGKTEAWRVYVTCSRFNSWKIQSQHLECCHPDTLYYLIIFAPVPSTSLSCLQNYFGFVPWTRFWRRGLLYAFSKGWGNCSWQSFKYFNYPWLGTRVCSQNHNLMFLTTLTCWSPWKAFLICEFRFCFWNQGTGFGGLLRPMPSRYGWVFCSSNRGWALRTNGQSGTSLTGVGGQQFWGVGGVVNIQLFATFWSWQFGNFPRWENTSHLLPVALFMECQLRPPNGCHKYCDQRGWMAFTNLKPFFHLLLLVF